MDVVFGTQGSLRQPWAEINIPFGELKKTLNSYQRTQRGKREPSKNNLLKFLLCVLCALFG